MGIVKRKFCGQQFSRTQYQGGGGDSGSGQDGLPDERQGLLFFAFRDRETSRFQEGKRGKAGDITSDRESMDGGRDEGDGPLVQEPKMSRVGWGICLALAVVV